MTPCARVKSDSRPEAIEKGLDRHRKRAESESGRNLLFEALQPMTEAVRSQQNRFLSRRQRVPEYALALGWFDAEKLAFITLRSILNAILTRGVDHGQAPSEAEITKVIRRWCRFERSFQDLQIRVRVGLELRDWSRDRHALKLGLFLVRLAVDHAVTREGAKLFERAKTFETERDEIKARKVVVRLTADAQRVLEEHRTWREALAPPAYVPMVAKPDQWTKSARGGYFAIKDIDLVKRGDSPRIRKALDSADLSLVFQAINALQDTPWRINREIYQVVQEALDRGLDLPGLPSDGGSRDPVKQSPQTSSPGAKWQNAQRRLMQAEIAERQGELLLLRERMEVSKAFLDEPFYFPYNVDHRGRAYPIPRTLHPQSDDLGRALLQFADGKPLDERGAYWLSIHLANLAGKEKEPLKSRAQWVNENEAQILNFAEAAVDCSEHRFWTIDEKPWSLLAACKEWARYHQSGPGTLSYLPILMDGTCNGLQHFSAMGRDHEGGKWTNLVPGDTPRDIYNEVARRANRKVLNQAQQGYAGAEEWVGRIDRKMAKIATMNKPYGITLRGIQEELVHKKKAEHCRDRWGGALYVARVLDECVKELVVKAVEIMEWLREMAEELAKANRGLRWTTPTGFVVVHEERRPKVHRIEIPYPTASGSIKTCTVRIAADGGRQRLNKTKQRNGIAPNFVHSMDAAHMMRTICRLHSEKRGHFAVIHDGYGVHACDVDLMNRILREEFLHIYQEPVLERFWEEQRRANPKLRLPDPPVLGDLDISLVLNSDYFFC